MVNLKIVTDEVLLAQIKGYVKAERDVVIKILHHLKEIERRRLYADLGYRSLFDYAVRELSYSDGQATRRIQSMRLLKDVPEVEEKIANGELSLSNAAQVQSFFREAQRANPSKYTSKKSKLEVLAKVENKSARDAQKELIKLQPEVALPKERERVVTEDICEVRFLLTDKLKEKLEEVRSLLGVRGATMSYAELFAEMADISIERLKVKRFGKKRTEAATQEKEEKSVTPTSAETVSKNSRYISREMKHHVWQRDKGQCQNCGSKHNLNFDHIHPVALGGLSTFENLRLLCFNCNQRASIKIFGEKSMDHAG